MLCEVNHEKKDATDGLAVVQMVQALQNLYCCLALIATLFPFSFSRYILHNIYKRWFTCLKISEYLCCIPWHQVYSLSCLAWSFLTCYGSHVSSSITDGRELGFIFECDSAIHEYITLSEQLERVSYLLCGMCQRLFS